MQCPCKGCSQDKRLALDESGKYTSAARIASHTGHGRRNVISGMARAGSPGRVSQTPKTRRSAGGS